MGSLQFPNMGMGLRLAAFGRRSSAIKLHDVRSKSAPWGYTPQSNSRGLPDPPPLGLDIDRCSERVLGYSAEENMTGDNALF